jgi:hypothetical protein
VWHDVRAEKGDPLVILFGPAVEDAFFVFTNFFPVATVDSEGNVSVLDVAPWGLFLSLGLLNGGLEPVSAVIAINEVVSGP